MEGAEDGSASSPLLGRPNITFEVIEDGVGVEISCDRYSRDDNEEDDVISRCDTPPQPVSHSISLLQKDYIRLNSNRNDELRHFRTSLQCWGLDQSSRPRIVLSWIIFVFFTFLVPLFTSLIVSCPQCDQQGYAFDKLVLFPQCILASIAFLCLSRYLRRYGLRKFLFLDQLCDDSPQVQFGYTKELDKAFKLLAWILFPSFLIEILHKILWYSSVTVSLPFIKGRILSNSIVFAAVVISWLYRTGVFLLVCVLFRLTCHLQILRFEGFKKFLEEYSSDVSIILKEHMRIRHQLFITSHRFRVFILASLLTMTISQFAALFMTLSSRTEINFFNAGDLVVCSAMQLTGFLLCLVGAARITHRVQGTVSVATRWHVMATCTSYGSSYPHTEDLPSPQSETEEASVNPFSCVDSASDAESSEVFFMFPSKDASAAFEIRQAFVTYLQHNSGGITLFGFVLDRGLLHTLFAFEFSLVMWILSKAIRFS